MRPLDLSGHVAVVTGAGRGIGRAIALALGECGAGVVLAARTQVELEQVAAEIRGRGGRALAVSADISDEAQVRRLFEQAGAWGGRLDVLVNNAGVGLFGALADFSAEAFDRVMVTNARGTFLCCREAMKLMIPRKAGYIINISSVVGFKGYPNQSAYTASKHAIMGLSKSLAVEAQPHGIRVTAILPGGVDTEMLGDARPDLDRSALLSTEDISRTVLYLLSLSERAAVDQVYIRRRTSQPW